MDPIRVFISYAHANAIWLRDTHRDRTGSIERNPRDLLTYWRNGLQFESKVEFWFDRDDGTGLKGGDRWETRILEQIDKADVTILLITQEFVQSSFIRATELPRIIARAQRGEMEVVPVLLEPAEWEDLEVGTFQLTPGRPTPISQYLAESEHHFKTAMLEVLKALKARVRRAKQRREAKPAPIQRSAEPAEPERAPADESPIQLREASSPAGDAQASTVSSPLQHFAAGRLVSPAFREIPPIDVPNGHAMVNEKDGSILVLVPEGEFTAGGSGPWTGGVTIPIRLPAFWLAVHPVTNRQYHRFVRETGHRPPSPVYKTDTWPRDWLRGNEYVKERADYPVVDVDWHDAIAYCDWAGLRLPTELEWEKGAKGPRLRDYPWGSSWDPTMCRNPSNRGKETTTSVWAYPEGRSFWGCYQMAGNVWEWCADGHEEGYYARLKALGGETNAVPTDSGERRVMRGGSWHDDLPEQFLCAYPCLCEPTRREPKIGFRVARTFTGDHVRVGVFDSWE